MLNGIFFLFFHKFSNFYKFLSLLPENDPESNSSKTQKIKKKKGLKTKCKDGLSKIKKSLLPEKLPPNSSKNVDTEKSSQESDSSSFDNYKSIEPESFPANNITNLPNLEFTKTGSDEQTFDDLNKTIIPVNDIPDTVETRSQKSLRLDDEKENSDPEMSTSDDEEIDQPIEKPKPKNSKDKKVLNKKKSKKNESPPESSSEISDLEIMKPDEQKEKDKTTEVANDAIIVVEKDNQKEKEPTKDLPIVETPESENVVENDQETNETKDKPLTAQELKQLRYKQWLINNGWDDETSYESEMDTNEPTNNEQTASTAINRPSDQFGPSQPNNSRKNQRSDSANNDSNVNSNSNQFGPSQPNNTRQNQRFGPANNDSNASSENVHNTTTTEQGAIESPATALTNINSDTNLYFNKMDEFQANLRYNFGRFKIACNKMKVPDSDTIHQTVNHWNIIELDNLKEICKTDLYVKQILWFFLEHYNVNRFYKNIAIKNEGLRIWRDVVD